MTFQPIVPMGGYAGWRFLQRTMPAQQAAFERSPQMSRDISYFEEKIGDITSAEMLVADRRLLNVALGAFGLDDDINNRFFIRKVLEDGSQESDALANRMADKRYLHLSKAFGFGDFDTPNTQLSDFADEIIANYKTRQFERAIGAQNENMRLAMNMLRELSDLAAEDSSDETKWFSIMGSKPLRAALETALGLPSEFAALDIDRQLEVFRTKSAKAFGTTEASQLASPETQDKLLRLFLARSEALAMPAHLTGATTALALLQAGR
ncbi:DUF1217 domain-containing protein [Actibacterium sp. XHP0104]|uniref:DUF1217 domain-containing protein n=1 Tax=Actibacterium sp. XHP0104 TaxID=2984335 RepID=UPI0021E7556D|nr:DUF1217 domain-containing protein [Actibacterium sp. XHP0104]MCV2881797.1 DUF1217 domain-containing protein [Actibacterium sp. XHP0104]